MGEVYRARDTRLERDVAVKVLPAAFADDPDRRARFDREAKAVAALSHPNILAIHDFGTHENITFAVMELLEGETLRSRLSKGPLPWRQTVEMATAIADGLTAAHAKGIVHRDLKPENLFLTTDGRVKILDFGLARIEQAPNLDSETSPHVPAQTDPGTVLGTIGYMSPEQVRGQPADTRSDIFSFGCVLYEMLTGQRAFQRKTSADTISAILRDEPPDPGTYIQHIPRAVEHTIPLCLRKNPDQRTQTACDLANMLRSIAPEGSDPQVLLSAPAFRRSLPRQAWIVAAMLLMALGITGVYFLMGTRPAEGQNKSSIDAMDTIAVLPFINEGDDPKTEYLSDGIANQIIDGLSQVRRQNLKVRPFTSVSRFKKKELDIPTCGRELNVQMIVTGKLQQISDDMSIHVAVINVRDDVQLWGHTYRGKRATILDMQDEIARDVATNLRLRLTDEEESRLTKRYTQDPEAYLLFREASYHFNNLSEQELEISIDYCRRAIKKDAGYALAYARLGRCYIALGSIYQGPIKTFPEAKSHLAKALQIDAAVPEAHSAMGVIHLFYDWDWKAAQRELKLGDDLNSNTPSWAPSYYGFYLAAMDQPPEALAVTRRSQELDPLSAVPRNHLATCCIWMRQYDQAIAESQKALELSPTYGLAYRDLGLAYCQVGQHEKAIEALQQGLRLTNGHPWFQGLLGYAYGRVGQSVEARRVLNDLNGLAAKGRFGSAFSIARIHAALGEKDQAFEWLRKAGDERDPLVIWLKVDPTMDNLRSDPRFGDLLKHVGLANETSGAMK
jgi:serine/threonine protein kinase/tetratricopeptide (TPR) repeat protein